MEREIAPRVKVLRDELDTVLLASPALDELDRERYGVLVRQRRAQKEIFPSIEFSECCRNRGRSHRGN